MLSAAYQMGAPVHIAHKFAKTLIQRIQAVGIEMRRTVRIRKSLRREGMGDKMIDAPDQEMIREVLHQPGAFRPAVGPEDLAHRIALFLRIQDRMG